MIETDLFDFAYVPDWYGQLDELSKLALPEPWRFKKPIYKTKNEDTMMNKLVFGHQMVLRPLLQSLRGLNDQSRLLKIEELETAIEKNREQKQVLTNLMASGYLEPALFNKESNELAAEAEALRQEKDGLMRSVNGDMVKIEELQRLLRFTSKGTMMTEFDDEIFLSFVERITVLSRKEVVFEWKCGLSLKERLVEP